MNFTIFKSDFMRLITLSKGFLNFNSQIREIDLSGNFVGYVNLLIMLHKSNMLHHESLSCYTESYHVILWIFNVYTDLAL